MTDSKVYDASNKVNQLKKEPLIFIITTEGNTVGGFLDSKLDYVRKMIKGEINDERVLPWLGYILKTQLMKYMKIRHGKKVIQASDC